MQIFINNAILFLEKETENRMNIVVAIDSFKGSLSTYESGEAVREAATRVFPEVDVTLSPLADGGEGTMRAICSALDGRIVTVTVTGPLGEPICAEYGVAGKTAIIEMAEAAGLTLVEELKRDPLHTTTYGIGEMILDAALRHECREFIVGIGGSATNDGGTGMLAALGVAFLREDNTPISLCGEGLSALAKINLKNLHPVLSKCHFKVACDVKNPLTGKDGCSYVFAPQKGANAETVERMDKWLERYADLTREILPHANAKADGAGAAGGMGFALCSYLGAELVGGVDLVIETTRLAEKIRRADLVITGEGRLDGQSCMGKAPIGVAACAKKYNKPVIAFSGAVTRDAVNVNEYGIDAFFPIVRTPCTLAEAMDRENAYANLRDCAEQVLRLWAFSNKK